MKCPSCSGRVLLEVRYDAELMLICENNLHFIDKNKRCRWFSVVRGTLWDKLQDVIDGVEYEEILARREEI
jgi:hypothetical protein